MIALCVRQGAFLSMTGMPSICGESPQGNVRTIGKDTVQ